MSTPLTKAQVSSCQAGMYECQLTAQEIEKAESCGLDCQEAKMRNELHREFYRQILANYSSLFQPAQS